MSTYNSHLHIVTWLKSILPFIINDLGDVPPIKTLAIMKGCSVASMHKAIKKLELDGLLVSRRGHGTCLRNFNSHFNPDSKKEIQEIL
jgi:DNA-binding GntR family transcriptional regulator